MNFFEFDESFISEGGGLCASSARLIGVLQRSGNYGNGKYPGRKDYNPPFSKTYKPNNPKTIPNGTITSGQ